MAKSTKASGDSYTEAEQSDPNPPPRVRRAMLGGEPKSVGTPSSEHLSSEKQLKTTGTPSPQEPAQMTESLSSLPVAEDSTVNSTDGNGLTETVKPYDEWLVLELQEECRARDLPVSGRKDDLVLRLVEDDELDEDFTE